MLETGKVLMEIDLGEKVDLGTQEKIWAEKNWGFQQN